jgi:hypothetical protein
MNGKIYILDELGKPASEVLKTAAKQGYVIDGDWSEHIDNIKVNQAFTKKELREHLREVVYFLKEAVTPNLKKLRLKDCRIVGGCYEDLDSTNLSHAGAYYAIAVELPEHVKEWLEKDQEVFTLEEIKKKRFDLF